MFQNFSVIFAPTELKVKARMNTLNVTWHPSPNHTLVSGYKISYREVDAEESNREKTPQIHTIRKKARYHLLTRMGRLWNKAPSNIKCSLLFSVFIPRLHAVI